VLLNLNLSNVRIYCDITRHEAKIKGEKISNFWVLSKFPWALAHCIPVVCICLCSGFRRGSGLALRGGISQPGDP
jgi:hypothetical protein